MGKIILHCDMDNYYASVECLDKPWLKYCPMAVCGDPDLRHGIILAKNYHAKDKGVITGETIYQAKEKCPNLVILKPDYPKYLKYAKLSRNIFKKYSKKVYPYGLDEAWIDISDTCKNFAEGKYVADMLRKEVKSSMGLTISIGVSFNYIFSKLASDMNKPDSTTVIPYENFKSHIRNLPAFEMLFVGPASRKILKKLRIITIGDLADSNKNLLKLHLGKKGIQLHEFANGNDDSFDPSTFSLEEIKSISNTITPPRNITCKRDAAAFIYLLSEAVSKRLELHNFRCRKITIILRFYDFSSITRGFTFSIPVNRASELFEHAFTLYNNNNENNMEIRSIGIRAEEFVDIDNAQLTIFDIISEDNETTEYQIMEMVEDIKKRYGKIKLEFNPFDNVERVI